MTKIYINHSDIKVGAMLSCLSEVVIIGALFAGMLLPNSRANNASIVKEQSNRG